MGVFVTQALVDQIGYRIGIFRQPGASHASRLASEFTSAEQGTDDQDAIVAQRPIQARSWLEIKLIDQLSGNSDLILSCYRCDHGYIVIKSC